MLSALTVISGRLLRRRCRTFTSLYSVARTEGPIWLEDATAAEGIGSVKFGDGNVEGYGDDFSLCG